MVFSTEEIVFLGHNNTALLVGFSNVVMIWLQTQEYKKNPLSYKKTQSNLSFWVLFDFFLHVVLPDSFIAFLTSFWNSFPSLLPLWDLKGPIITYAVDVLLCAGGWGRPFAFLCCCSVLLYLRAFHSFVWFSNLSIRLLELLTKTN